MSDGATELSVSQARDRFSDAVNRAIYAGEVTFVTRGRGHIRAAAIVPAAWVEAYERWVDHEDGLLATQRLTDLREGQSQVISAEAVAAEFDL
jgi:hypothetical protein